jgi:RNA polymerase sigma-70 factor (ECF subfamily)
VTVGSGLDRVYDSAMSVVPDPVRPVAAPAEITRRVEELYTAHVRLVRSICRSLLRDRNEAEDAVQQTYLSAQRALTNGSSPREPAAWLAVIARNECLARVRERMREPLPVDAEPTEFGADAYASAVSRYEVATLREALADLPRAQREAILLRELRGLSYDEVARALSVTTGAVESLIFRARRTLQVKLSEAMTALSPVALFARLFGSGGGGDLAGPAVAKVAVIGVGAAMLAGGAALGPHALGLGHAAPKAQHSAQPVHLQASQRLIPAAPVLVPDHSASARAVSHEVEHEAKASESEAKASGVRETVASEPADTKSSETEKETAPTTTVPSTPAIPPSPGNGGSEDSGGDAPDNPGPDN